MAVAYASKVTLIYNGVGVACGISRTKYRSFDSPCAGAPPASGLSFIYDSVTLPE